MTEAANSPYVTSGQGYTDGADTTRLDNISNALNATLNPRIPNSTRQQALQHLEAYKSQPDAPQNGFALAIDYNQSAAVRYYGLQLLEFAVRYRWNEYNSDQTAQLRQWVWFLADGVRDHDAFFTRNKIGQLWTEVAKRSWGDEWMDMDKQLLNLWDKPEAQNGIASKILVLNILETLSDEIINNEDAVAGLRLETLGGALNEIMIPAGLYEQHLQIRSNTQEVRYGEPGWMARICEFLSYCVKQANSVHASEQRQSMETCAVRALNALRPTLVWANLKAVEEVGCIDYLFLAFLTSNVAQQIAAVEVLFALLNRPYGSHHQDTWTRLLRQAMEPGRIAIIRQTFEQTHTGPGEDDEKYTLHKKMSELLSVLAESVAQRPELADSTIDLPSFLELLILVLQSKSLTVSIPVLHSWTKLITVQETKIVDLVLNAFGTLLHVCSERLLRYEACPESSEDDIISFLDEDFDTVPERHAFLGNYRRYCTNTIQQIARSRPLEALSYSLDQMRSALHNGPYTSARGFESSAYSKTSLPALRFDAYYNVVSSVLKGYAAWTGDVAELTSEDALHERAEKDLREASDSLQQWCHSMVNIHTDDPTVAEQVLETLVMVLKTLKNPAPSFVLHMVQHLLTMRLYDDPAQVAFSDAVKVFECLRVVELQKLALAFPNDLLEVYHELEPRVAVLAQKHGDDQRLVWGYKAFLFMIIHRADGIEQQVKMNRLRTMLEPTYQAWSDQSLGASVDTLQRFCESVGLGNIAEFYEQNGFHTVQDWSAQQLDAAGQARQAEIKERSDKLPLRMTKSMLAATTEKLKSGSDEYGIACELWGSLISAILPNLLQMLRQAQAFHNMANWSPLPDELQSVIRRTLQDRFWQSGISNESKDQFYARISGSKTSYEGFASTVRGTMRLVREQGYHVLYLMTKFEEQFYGLVELAEPLAQALFVDAGSLSANHLHAIINLTTGLVQRCPPHHRAQFLPPILIRLFVSLDAKISAEWEAISAAAELHRHQNDELSDEMRTESVLRQLTYSMVSFVPFLLEYDTMPHLSGQQRTNCHAPPPVKPTLSDVVLSNPLLLEPMMLFCTHALRMRDTRCCSTICRVFRNLVPLFAHTDHHPTSAIPIPVAGQVREFICNEVLKACITSLNEPYFADMQKDLASLIAQIINTYSPITTMPREVLLSLPEMTDEKIDAAILKIRRCKHERAQRSLVLELLEGVRGVSIYEAGKIQKAVVKKRAPVQAQYMEAVEQPLSAPNGEDIGLEGVADLFGQG